MKLIQKSKTILQYIVLKIKYFSRNLEIKSKEYNTVLEKISFKPIFISMNTSLLRTSYHSKNKIKIKILFHFNLMRNYLTSTV